MTLKRNMELIPRRIIKFITKDKYYICEDCHKLHKRDGKEFDICSKWAITVNNECANKTIKEAYNLLTDAVLRDMK